MQTAISKWRAACNVDAAYAGTTSVDPEHAVLDSENGPQPDQINVVGWRATPSGIAGYTVGYSQPAASGEWPIIDADVVVDPTKLPDAGTLERLLVHEFGHVIGLNHSQFDATLMSGPPYSTYNTLDALSTDDVRGCQCLYGPPPGQSAGLLCSIPPVLDFGQITVGEAPQQAIQLKNNGNASITISGVTSANPAYQSTGCGAGTTLVPGQTCNMQVTYTPSAAGDFGSQLSIAVNEPEPYRIKLVGTATGGAASAFSTDLTQVDFGTWAIGTPSTTQRVKLKNITSATVTIGSLLFEGPEANEFVRSGQCKAGMVLAASATCTVDVGFTAAASGLRSALLVVVASDGRRSSITVKGTGQTSAGTPEPGTAQPVTVVEFLPRRLGSLLHHDRRGRDRRARHRPVPGLGAHRAHVQGLRGGADRLLADLPVLPAAARGLALLLGEPAGVRGGRGVEPVVHPRVDVGDAARAAEPDLGQLPARDAAGVSRVEPSPRHQPPLHDEPRRARPDGEQGLRARRLGPRRRRVLRAALGRDQKSVGCFGVFAAGAAACTGDSSAATFSSAGATGSISAASSWRTAFTRVDTGT
jgi:hypothetical protein